MSQNLCVDNPEIKEIFILETGDYLTAQQAIGSDYNELIKLRMELSESISNNKPKYVCPICLVGVYIACNRHRNDKKFYFKHLIENGNCPARTRGHLTKDEIEAIRYNGAKESPAHFRMKEIIAESLSCDANFTDIKTEIVIKGQDRKKWRKPDVQALWKGKLRVAFEVQLSTTFLEVISQRRLFYKAEGGLICWVFKKFDKENALMTQDDIFFNNNQNLFLASEDTLQSSKQNKSLILNCHWNEPTIQNGRISDIWNSKFVSFKELENNLDTQSIYYFDYKNHKERLTKNLYSDDLKKRFEKWWCSHVGTPPYDEVWRSFEREFKSKKIYLPQYPSKTNHILNALYSAKHGKSIGWKHPKFISIAHLVAGRHKGILQIFRVALFVYERADQIRLEDSEGKWIKKSNEFRKLVYINDEYEIDKKFDGLISFLFPELTNPKVWERIRELDEKHNKKD